MEPTEKVGVNGLEFISGTADYKMRWTAPYKAIMETSNAEAGAAANVEMGAILYCCGNHKPSPHCDEDANKLGAECKDIKIKF